MYIQNNNCKTLSKLTIYRIDFQSMIVTFKYIYMYIILICRVSKNRLHPYVITKKLFISTSLICKFHLLRQAVLRVIPCFHNYLIFTIIIVFTLLILKVKKRLSFNLKCFFYLMVVLFYVK